MLTHLKIRLAVSMAASIALAGSAAPLLADSYLQTNLDSSVPGLAATTDPNLINPWGMAFTATSPFWVSDQGSGKSTLYDGAGTINALVVTVPGGGPPSGPTGIVANSTTGFQVNGVGAHFIFDTLNGTIAGWASGSSAVTEVTTPGAVYTGLAIGSVGVSTFLYAADSTGQIRVFDSSYNPTSLAGNFTDPNAKAGFVPFNIQLIGPNLYVEYAQLNHGAALPGGYIDIFDTSGNFIERLTSDSSLFAPWGVTLAPASFGSFGNDLLVGNFGNGIINAFNPISGAYVGTLDDGNGLAIVNQNLWALDFRTGGKNDAANTLYFTAGINGERSGLFGSIAPSPEPATLILDGLGLCALGFSRLRRFFA